METTMNKTLYFYKKEFLAVLSKYLILQSELSILKNLYSILDDYEYQISKIIKFKDVIPTKITLEELFQMTEFENLQEFDGFMCEYYDYGIDMSALKMNVRKELIERCK
jgi:hypothetical protein